MSSKPVTLGRAIDEYFKSDLMRAAAEATRYQHRRTLKALTRVCTPGRSVTLVTAADLSAALELLSQPADAVEVAAIRTKGGAAGIRKGRNEVTLNIDRSVLRTFVRYLHNADLLPRSVDPSASLRSVPRRRPMSNKRQPMLREAVLRLFDIAGEYHPRERIAVALAALAGMRQSEICELRWRDVHWSTPDGPVLDFFRPKGHDAHRVMVSPFLERELRAWHAFYSARHPEMYPSWFVVPTRQRGWMPDGKTGRKMSAEWPLVPDRRSPRQLHTIVKPMMAQAGVTDLLGKGMHTLRRTFANALREDSGDIRIVQSALGHKSQLTTEVYLDRDRDFQAAAAAMRDWNPFSKVNTAADGNVIPMRKRATG